MKGRVHFKKRTVIIVAVALVLAMAAGVAYAATTSFSDVPSTYWAFSSITKLAGQSIILGHPNGTFGPEDPVTRAQAATMLDRLETYLGDQATAPLDSINRGCTACHPIVATTPDPNNPFKSGAPDPKRAGALTFSLKWEAMGSDPSTTRFNIHAGMALDSTITACLPCHGPGANAQSGSAAPKSLRVIVHPAHMFSGIFISEFRGNCFSCHEIGNDGVYYVLGLKMAVESNGSPSTIPTPGMLKPTAPAS